MRVRELGGVIARAVGAQRGQRVQGAVGLFDTLQSGVDQLCGRYGASPEEVHRLPGGQPYEVVHGNFRCFGFTSFRSA